jgi:hypothetical protein
VAAKQVVTKGVESGLATGAREARAQRAQGEAGKAKFAL